MNNSIPIIGQVFFFIFEIDPKLVMSINVAIS